MKRRLALILPLMATIVALKPESTTAQTGRTALALGNEAYNNFDFPEAIRLLSRGLDPAAGPRDSTWVLGLHQMVEALLEQGADGAANTWLRWAYRLQPAIPVDSNNFATNVTSTFETARAFVGADSLDRFRLEQSWDWTLAGDPTANGSLQIQPSRIGVNGQVEGGGFLRAGTNLPRPTGTYTVVASAADYLPTRTTVEVLPGIVTILNFELDPVRAGFLYVAARPWGEVFVDDRSIGNTTVAQHRLGLGTHRVRIERPGYMPFDTTITVGADERVRLGTIQLRRREEQQ